MSATAQLTLEGAEASVTTGRPGQLSRGVLLELLRRGSLTSTQAGELVHEFIVGCPAEAERWLTGDYGGAGCCSRASTDGSRILKRLERRGLAVKHLGLWFGVEA